MREKSIKCWTLKEMLENLKEDINWARISRKLRQLKGDEKC